MMDAFLPAGNFRESVPAALGLREPAPVLWDGQMWISNGEVVGNAIHFTIKYAPVQPADMITLTFAPLEVSA